MTTIFERPRGLVEAPRNPDHAHVRVADSSGALSETVQVGETPAGATETVALPQTVAVLIRACADCEQEHGVLDRSNASKSHGHCRRHWLKLVQQTGCSTAEIESALLAMSPDAFCPDLAA